MPASHPPPHGIAAAPTPEAAGWRALSAGIVSSERHRVAIFAGLVVTILGLIGWLLSGPSTVAPEALNEIRRAAPLMVSALAALLVYEAVAWVWLGRLMRSDREPSTAFRYVNAAIEASAITGLLALAMGPMGPLYPLLGAAPWGYFPFLALTALNLNPRLSTFSGVIAAAGFAAVSLLALRSLEPVPGLAILTSPHQYVVKALFLLLSGLASAFVAKRLRQQLMESLRTARERDRAVSIFGQHVSPQVADRLLNQPVDLTGEERQVCVLFLDIRDFSRLAGERSPAEVMDYLNRLFGAMIQTVNDHRGIVNKFLGDGFMAVFGAPLDDARLCQNAVNCSRELLRIAQELSASGNIPPTRIGIGLHLGPALTGNVGSEQRKEYTVIGDTVNLAARIEQATKSHQAQLLVSEAVWSALGNEATQAEDLGLVELKGQARPTRLFKLA
jgi:adenylate cyclase